jgi:acetyl-CoA carboxylase carboxyl transferase subunit beta
MCIRDRLDAELSAMDVVRIVRHPQRVSLKDILENVYDNYTEIGGQDEYSIDPSMLIARAYITRRRGDKVHHQPVMVIGQEKGHGQEFRNGGSVKPWGNAKALQYMKVAETEKIPIHTYVSTPGAFPVEDYPGAAQQIARNLYEMAGLKVPVVSVISEGGSGGAEAIGLSDARLMFSHGYYSVISPEGAAAIEAGIRQGQRVAPELIAACASRLKMTAKDNLSMGYVDRIIQEPHLGVRSWHYDFFKILRQEVIRATDQVFLSITGMKFFRAMALGRHKDVSPADAENMYVRWSVDEAAAERLLWRRYRKYRRMAETPSWTAAPRPSACIPGCRGWCGRAIPFCATTFWASRKGACPRPWARSRASCGWWWTRCPRLSKRSPGVRARLCATRKNPACSRSCPSRNLGPALRTGDGPTSAPGPVRIGPLPAPT